VRERGLPHPAVDHTVAINFIQLHLSLTLFSRIATIFPGEGIRGSIGGRAMLTSYSVKCGHGCGWSGSLLPRDNLDSWVGALPTVSEAVFECPRCRGQWVARIKGEDVETVRLREKETNWV
jgi:hypothetical protein